MDDRRLERLYDYTKFHIGIYLSAAGGLTTLISLANKDKIDMHKYFGLPWAVGVSLLFMVLAGIAGAVVATSAIESETYIAFIKSPQSVYGFKLLGKTWVTTEHACFWVSLAFLLVSVFSAVDVRCWLIS